ncbi:MAG: 4'-phosphopantetheinyl transferase superfamily protein [Coriobacteriales bacterium]|jgi:phosphopantetheinyl transferase (holo-ACP synthase)|nr:4'-phosphopantetheinyl transferase superfamily protein [Coriobacteriales bacterium]
MGKPVIDVVYVMLNQYAEALSETVGPLVSRLNSCVCPARAEHSKSLLRPHDRLASLVAGALIDIVSAPFTGGCVVPVVTGAYGKPDFAEGFGLHFSLSHSRNAACCAVSQRPVGIDIERSIDSCESLFSLCLADAELACIKDCSNRVERIRLFTKLWTRKEALGKYLGCGLNELVLRTDVLHWPGDTAGFLVCRHIRGVQGAVPQIESFELFEAYMSVCGYGRVRVTSRTLSDVLAPAASGICNPSYECEL